MKGLISEGEEAMEEDAAAPISDVMLIAAAQKVEHYEISAYGTLKAIAEQMGEDRVVRLLDKTLAEEEEADQKLTAICQRLLGEASQSEEEEAA
jgi:ferritin-like metal-binding protein YciE